jgi:hypothetical protein
MYSAGGGGGRWLWTAVVSSPKRQAHAAHPPPPSHSLEVLLGVKVRLHQILQTAVRLVT